MKNEMLQPVRLARIEAFSSGDSDALMLSWKREVQERIVDDYVMEVLRPRFASMPGYLRAVSAQEIISGSDPVKSKSPPKQRVWYFY